MIINHTNLAEEIYELLADIKDPEFPQTLGELKVVKLEDIIIELPMVRIFWTPTVQHCNFAFQIVLSLRVKLQRELLGYSQLKIVILVKPGTHKSEQELNKQSNDKERVRAAMENQFLMDFIEKLL